MEKEKEEKRTIPGWRTQTALAMTSALDLPCLSFLITQTLSSLTHVLPSPISFLCFRTLLDLSRGINSCIDFANHIALVLLFTLRDIVYTRINHKL